MVHEVVKDLFDVSGDYHLAHCISSDLKMGAGIALPMQNRFKIREAIMSRPMNIAHPTVALTGKVFNLITKANYYDKPTYGNLFSSLTKMKNIMKYFEIHKVAMPRIGCGLDRLDWCKVKEYLEKNFKDYEILVCRMK